MYPDNIPMIRTSHLGCASRDIINQVLGFAICAHRNQRRKYTNRPYVEHCVEVAAIVSGVAGEAEICAALLHDVLEDTDVTLEQLVNCFGNQVARLVLEVTDVSKPEDGKREVRKSLDRMHLAKASIAGATIKLADIISNTKSIVEYDKRFASVYIPEKMAVLEVLRNGNRHLWDVAYHQLKAAEAELMQAA